MFKNASKIEKSCILISSFILILSLIFISRVGAVEYSHNCSDKLQYLKDVADLRIPNTKVNTETEFQFMNFSIWNQGYIQEYALHNGQSKWNNISYVTCSISDYCIRVNYNFTGTSDNYRAFFTNASLINMSGLNYSGIGFWYLGNSNNDVNMQIEYKDNLSVSHTCLKTASGFNKVPLNNTEWRYAYFDFGDCDNNISFIQPITNLRIDIYNLTSNANGTIYFDNISLIDIYKGKVGDLYLQSRTTSKRNGRNQEGILSMARLYLETNNETYLNYTIEMGDWMVRNQLPCGGWTEVVNQLNCTSANTGFTGIAFIKTLLLLKDNPRMSEYINTFRYTDRLSGEWVNLTRQELWNYTAERNANYSLSFVFPSTDYVFNQYPAHLHCSWLYANYSNKWEIYNSTIYNQLAFMNNSFILNKFNFGEEENTSTSIGLDGHYYIVGLNSISWFYIDSKIPYLKEMIIKYNTSALQILDKGFYIISNTSRGGNTEYSLGMFESYLVKIAQDLNLNVLEQMVYDSQLYNKFGGTSFDYFSTITFSSALQSGHWQEANYEFCSYLPTDKGIKFIQNYSQYSYIMYNWTNYTSLVNLHSGNISRNNSEFWDLLYGYNSDSDYLLKSNPLYLFNPFEYILNYTFPYFNNALLSFSNGSKLYPISGDVNITLNPNEYVYVYDNYCTNASYTYYSDGSCRYNAAEVCNDFASTGNSFIDFIIIFIIVGIGGFMVLMLMGSDSNIDLGSMSIIVLICMVVISLGMVIINSINC